MVSIYAHHLAGFGYICFFQERELKDAGVPVPSDVSADRKSFTLPAGPQHGRCAIGVLCLD